MQKYFRRHLARRDFKELKKSTITLQSCKKYFSFFYWFCWMNLTCLVITIINAVCYLLYIYVLILAKNTNILLICNLYSKVYTDICYISLLSIFYTKIKCLNIYLINIFLAVVRADIVRRQYSIMINLRQQVAKRLNDKLSAALQLQSGRFYLTSCFMLY